MSSIGYINWKQVISSSESSPLWPKIKLGVTRTSAYKRADSGAFWRLRPRNTETFLIIWSETTKLVRKRFKLPGSVNKGWSIKNKWSKEIIRNQTFKVDSKCQRQFFQLWYIYNDNSLEYWARKSIKITEARMTGCCLTFILQLPTGEQ